MFLSERGAAPGCDRLECQAHSGNVQRSEASSVAGDRAVTKSHFPAAPRLRLPGDSSLPPWAICGHSRWKDISRSLGPPHRTGFLQKLDWSTAIQHTEKEIALGGCGPSQPAGPATSWDSFCGAETGRGGQFCKHMFPPSAFYLEKQVHSGAVQSKILRRPSFLTLQELGQAYEGGSGKQAEGPKPCSKVS